VFRRRRGQPADEPAPDDAAAEDAAEGSAAEGSAAEGSAADDRAEAVRRPAGRPTGPWDVDDVPADEVVRLDLGSLLIPGEEGVEIQVNLDEATGGVVAVTVVIGTSALQLQAFAAPRSEAIWPEVRAELAAEIVRDGGRVVDADDGAPDGPLAAELPFPQPDGSTALGPVRFVATDGPRWMLRGVLSGMAAVDAAAAEPLLDVYRGVVVVRGSDPYAPREPLALRLPGDAPTLGRG
jgi:hypothetical protein